MFVVAHILKIFWCGSSLMGSDIKRWDNWNWWWPWWWLSGPSAHPVCCLWGRTLSAVWWPRQWLEQRSVGSGPDRRKGFQQTSLESLAFLCVRKKKKSSGYCVKREKQKNIKFNECCSKTVKGTVYHSCSMWKHHAASARQSPCPVGWAPGSQAGWHSHEWQQGHDHQSCNSTYPEDKHSKKIKPVKLYKWVSRLYEICF